MVTRGDLLWLGISAGVAGALVGGLLLGIGLNMMVHDRPIGLVLITPAVPIASLPGWISARRLAKRTLPEG